MTPVTGQRRLGWATVLLGASASAVFVVSACGGSTTGGATSAPATSVAATPTPTPVTLTQSDFVSNANMVCLNASQYATAAPTPTSAIASFTNPAVSELPTIGAYFTSLIALYQGMYTQLQALGAPPSNQAGWSQALSSYQTVMADFQAAQSAANSSDLAGYKTALAKEHTDNVSAVQAFTQFGASMCATDAEPTPV